MTLEKALEILNLDINFTEEELKKQYHKLALENHPDYNKSADAEENMKRINEAKEVLEKYLKNKNSYNNNNNRTDYTTNKNNFKEKVIAEFAKKLEKYKDSTNNLKLVKYNEMIDKIINDFKVKISSMLIDINPNTMLKIEGIYNKSIEEIMSIFGSLIMDFGEEKNIDFQNIDYHIICNLIDSCENLTQLYQKLEDFLKNFQSLTTELGDYEYINGYEVLKDEINNLKYDALEKLLKYGELNYPNIIYKLKNDIRELFNKYFNAITLASSLINDIEEFNKDINDDKLNVIYKEVVSIKKTLESSNLDNKFLNLNINKLNMLKDKFDLIKKLYLLLKLNIKSNQSEYNKYIAEIIIKALKQLPLSSTSDNRNIYKKSSNEKDNCNPILKEINDYFVYINKNNESGYIKIVNIVDINYDSISIQDLLDYNHEIITISKQEFLDNYILIPELLYFGSKVLYINDTNELVFINDNSSYNFIYSFTNDDVYVTDNININENDAKRIYPSKGLFNQIKKITKKLKFKLLKFLDKNKDKQYTKKRSKHFNN